MTRRRIAIGFTVALWAAGFSFLGYKKYGASRPPAAPADLQASAGTPVATPSDTDGLRVGDRLRLAPAPQWEVAVVADPEERSCWFCTHRKPQKFGDRCFLRPGNEIETLSIEDSLLLRYVDGDDYNTECMDGTIFEASRTWYLGMVRAVRERAEERERLRRKMEVVRRRLEAIDQ